MVAAKFLFTLDFLFIKISNRSIEYEKKIFIALSRKDLKSNFFISLADKNKNKFSYSIYA